MRTYKPLRHKTPLKPIGKKGKARMTVWADITAKRLAKIYLKFGYHLCEYCGRAGNRTAPFNPLDPHHIIDKGKGGKDTPENCFICHRLCHDIIQLNHIDVSEFKKVFP